MQKIIVIFLFISSKSFCQCPQWNGSSIATAETLLPVIQKYFEPNMQKTIDTSGNKIYNAIEYKDDKTATTFRIGWYVKKELQGSKWVILPPLVNDIYIKGPADKIDLLFSDLNRLAKSCTAYSNGNEQGVKFSKNIMIWGDADKKDSIAMKFISIKPFTQNK